MYVSYIDDGPCLGWRESATGPYNWIKYSQVSIHALQLHC